MKNVYTIIESKSEDKKAFWLKIGAAFENKDGSLNVILNALPMDGKLHIREPNKNDNNYGNRKDNDYSPF